MTYTQPMDKQAAISFIRSIIDKEGSFVLLDLHDQYGREKRPFEHIIFPTYIHPVYDPDDAIIERVYLEGDTLMVEGNVVTEGPLILIHHPFDLLSDKDICRFADFLAKR